MGRWLPSRARHLLPVLLLIGLGGCDDTLPAEHLANANRYRADGETAAAIIELKNALQKAPDLGDARLMLGVLSLEQGDPASAIKELERALDLGVDPAAVMPPLLRAKLELQRYQEVLGSLDAQGELTPELRVIRGNALLQAGDAAGARAAFNAALSETPDDVDALVGLAKIAWANGDTEHGAALLDRAVALDPGRRQAWRARAELFVQLGRYEDALAAYQILRGLPGAEVEARLGIARVRLVQGQPQAAAEELAVILEAAPDYPPARYLEALIAFQQRDFARSESALLAVQQVAPDHVPSMFLLGAIKYHDGQYAQARNLLGRFLSRHERNVPARKLLAAMSLQQDDAAGAVEVLSPIAADLADPQGLALLGTAYMRTGQLAEATEYFSRAADAAPDVAALRTQLALGLLASGDRQGAVTELQAAVDMDDSLVRNEVLLVLIHLRAGEFDEALARAEVMVAEHPDDPVGHNLMGAALLGLDRTEDGEAAFRAALVADPAFTPAVTNLARLAIQRGSRDEAEGLYDALLAADPDNLRARMGLAELAVAAGDRPRAMEQLQDARREHANAFEPRLVLARLSVLSGELTAADEYIEEAMAVAPRRLDVQLLAASIDIDTGDLDSARERVGALHARGADGKSEVSLYLPLATMQRRLGQNEQARENFERVLARQPDRGAARAGVARLDITAGDVEAARAAIAVLASSGWNPPVRELIEGDLAALENRTDDALAHYQEAAAGGIREGALKSVGRLAADGAHPAAADAARSWLATHPDDDGMRLLLANSLLRTGGQTEAIAVYERIDSGAPSPVVLNNLAWLYLQQRDDRALATARRALELAPGSAEIQDTLGWILVNEGQADGGLEFLAQAAAVLETNGSVLYHLGVAQKRVGNPAAARSSLEAALETGAFPERDDAERELSELRS